MDNSTTLSYYRNNSTTVVRALVVSGYTAAAKYWLHFIIVNIIIFVKNTCVSHNNLFAGKRMDCYEYDLRTCFSQ